MKTKSVLTIATVAVVLALGGGIAKSAQDKYTLRVPNGLAFSEFRGYENWQVVSVTQTADLLKVMVANPTMIDAYRSGVPGNGKPFPDGSKIAKIEWKPKKMRRPPFWRMCRTPCRTFSSSRRTASDSRLQRDGHTRCLTMCPRPTRSSRIRPAPSIAVSRAIRSWRTKTTFFTRIRNGERADGPVPSAHKRPT